MARACRPQVNIAFRASDTERAPVHSRGRAPHYAGRNIGITAALTAAAAASAGEHWHKITGASLSHTENGIYGEMWAAALLASAFTAGTAREALESSLEHVPPRSRLAEVVRDVMDLHAGGITWDEALVHIQNRFGHYSWVHTLNNAALVVAALLWGRGTTRRSDRGVSPTNSSTDITYGDDSDKSAISTP